MSGLSSTLVRPGGRSLYARAALFILTGGGALFGAIVVLSQIIVEDSKARLLDERMTLARTVGSLIEDRIRGDMARLVDRASLLLAAPAGMSDSEGLTEAVSHGAFSEGAFVLDPRGEPLPIGSAPPPGLLQAAEVRRLVASARAHRDIVVSNLVYTHKTPLVVVVAPVPTLGRPEVVAGFVAGLLQPVAKDLLEALKQSGIETVGLVDSKGVFVAAADPRQLFTGGDHGGVLAAAIRDHKEVRGRCHSCHQRGDQAASRVTDVLAFAPLPTLRLGLTVLQPEAEALALAFSLRDRLWMLGGPLLLLFAVFALLAVRSVVRPVTLLTRAVRRAEASSEPIPTGFGDDEVGELAIALANWRERTKASLQATEALREAQLAESEAIRQHLQALQGISEVSTSREELGALLEHSLDQALALSSLHVGALSVEHRGQSHLAQRGLSEAEISALLTAARSHPNGDTLVDLRSAVSVRFGTSLGAVFAAPGDLLVSLVLADPLSNTHTAPTWIGSLLRHVGMCAAQLLLRDAVRERQQQQQRYLHRVLKAQEDERSRVARDLHDTVAQDLSALRLEIERLSNLSTPATPKQLAHLEESAKGALDTVRRILLDLRLSLLESMGFVAAARLLVERVERDHGLKARFLIDGDETQVIDYQTSVALYRILQESLQNVVQHAEAEHVFVSVRIDSTTVEMTIEDDGDGFDSTTARSDRPGSKRGLGILGMEERARLIGGTLRVTSAKDEGTTVHVTAPVHSVNEALG